MNYKTHYNTKTMKEAIDTLTYKNYKANRELRPDIDPNRWAKVYGESAVNLMERKLNDELSAELYDGLGDTNPLWSSEV